MFSSSSATNVDSIDGELTGKISLGQIGDRTRTQTWSNRIVKQALNYKEGSEEMVDSMSKGVITDCVYLVYISPFPGLEASMNQPLSLNGL